MAKYLICVSDNRHDDYEIERKMLSSIGAELRICDCKTPQDIAAQCCDADAILLNLAPMTAEAIGALKHCRVINRYGVGYDNVDLKAAEQAGIAVTNVPDYCMEDVSDHALALLMTCLRQTAFRDRKIRDGAWNIQKTSFRLAGKTLGVIGAGRIARALIRKTSGFGLHEIVAYDPYVSAEDLASIGVRKVDLDELLAVSDFVSLHLHVTEATKEIINRRTLKKMKQTAILINVSRGALINDEDLLFALQNGTILAAGLDTHNNEPLGPDSAFCKMDNVVLTDHTAYATIEGVRELKEKSAQNIIDELSGSPSKNRVTYH